MAGNLNVVLMRLVPWRELASASIQTEAAAGRSLAKSIHKQIPGALTYERCECVSALRRRIDADRGPQLGRAGARIGGCLGLVGLDRLAAQELECRLARVGDIGHMP